MIPMDSLLSLNSCFEILLFPVFIILNPVWGYEAEANLLDALQNSLTKYSPPVNLFNNTVYIDLNFIQFLQLDPKMGVIVLTVEMTLNYHVLTAAWDPIAFEGIDTLTVAPNTFWTPDIRISKLVEEIHRTSAKQIIQADRGMVTAMSSLVTIKVPCEFNMGRFPYDMHNCSVFIGPWKEHLSQYKIALGGIDAAGHSKTLLGGDILQNPEWFLNTPIYIKVVSDETGQKIAMELSLSREPSYYMMLFAFPAALLLILNAAAHFIPVDWTEKMSFTVTIFLAQVLTFTTMSNMLPANVQTLPAFAIFIINAITIMCTTCVTSVVSIKIYTFHRRGMKMPKCLRGLVASRIMRFVALPVHRHRVQTNPPYDDPNYPTYRPPIREPTPAYQAIYRDHYQGRISPPFVHSRKATSASPSNASNKDDSSTSSSESPDEECCAEEMWRNLAMFTERSILCLQIIHIVILAGVMLYMF